MERADRYKFAGRLGELPRRGNDGEISLNPAVLAGRLSIYPDPRQAVRLVFKFARDGHGVSSIRGAPECIYQTIG